jgi:hypothetical protein
VNELLKQASWAAAPISAGHFRTKDGAEVDLVLERDDGALVGVEIKAASAARPADAVGLRVLRELPGDAFLGGVDLYLGERTYQFGHKIWAVRSTGFGPCDRALGPSARRPGRGNSSGNTRRARSGTPGIGGIPGTPTDRGIPERRSGCARGSSGNRDRKRTRSPSDIHKLI